MNKTKAAVEAIEGQFKSIRGIAPDEEANLGVALAPLLTELLTALIQNCFGGFSDTQVAEAMVNPSTAQSRAFQRQCRRKANQKIKRAPNKNPTGQRISAAERNRLRAELAQDLFDSMTATAETGGVDEVTELVAEVRQS